jgi:hypothetical protein
MTQPRIGLSHVGTSGPLGFKSFQMAHLKSYRYGNRHFGPNWHLKFKSLLLKRSNKNG